MTPKEKAKELVGKFSVNVSVHYTENSVQCMINAPMINKQVKRFALICVDEILSLIDSKGNGYYTLFESDRKDYDYWQEVKQEIEEL